MGRKKGAYRYGKAISFDYRIGHPVVRKPEKGGKADSIPITHSAKSDGHRHIRLPQRVRISGRYKSKNKGPSYAVSRVIEESAGRLSAPLPSRFTKADNDVLRRIFKKRKAKKKG